MICMKKAPHGSMGSGINLTRSDVFDEISEAKMFHEEGKQAFVKREPRVRRQSNVQDNITFFEGEQNKKGPYMQVDVCVAVDEHVERLARGAHQ